MRRTVTALFALTLMAGAARAQGAKTPDLTARIEASMTAAETLARETSFPRANAIAEVAKAIREDIYAQDLTPSAMVSALDKVAAASPVTEIGAIAIKEVREEIEYAG